jgi:ribulose-5-phosphate 4-epimerase/fuculose-1-phosphate aldolase
MENNGNKLGVLGMLDFMKEFLKKTMKEGDEELYVDLCRTLGPLTDLVQSTGGNISVKDELLDLLLVKKSGSRIVNCDFQTYSLKEIRSIVEKNEKLPEGASIETYFHTLPSKIVVHLHPGPALEYLTNPFIHPSISNTSSYKMIEYQKPGYDLYKSILPYKDEKILLLQNHGILLFGETKEEIIESLQEIKQSIFTFGMKSSDILFVSMFRNMMREKYNLDLLLKPYMNCLNGFTFYDRIFFPYTPDHAVFLTKAPFMIEPKPTVWSIKILHSEFEKHLSMFKEFPTIVCIDGMIYTCAKTFDGCISLEEMLYSYFCISNKSAVSLSEEDVCKLKSWDSELERRKKLGLTNIITHST